MPFHRGAPHGRPPLKQWGVEDAAPYEILSKNGTQGSASRMTRATLALHFLQYVQCVIVRPVRTPTAAIRFPSLDFHFLAQLIEVGREHRGDAPLLHSDAVEHVRLLHGAAPVGDDDELSLARIYLA
mgnify:CR=1 FL=1